MPAKANPSLNNITCPPNLISDPFTSIPSCPNFSGWNAAGGTPDYFTGDIECGNPAFCIQTPIDPSMIGFRTYSDFPCNTPQTPYTEAVQGIVSVAPNQPYIFSFFRTIEPQEPETRQNPGNLQLENLSVFLTDAFTYVPMGLTINCLPIPANNTPQPYVSTGDEIGNFSAKHSIRILFGNGLKRQVNVNS